jgi:transposase-like protein
VTWPDVPIESIPPRRFRPPHCPWPECPARRLTSAPTLHRHGSYRRTSDHRKVPRFLCPACSRTCSLQTFTTSYYLKRPLLSAPIAAGIVAGSAHRQLARSLNCSPHTVTRRAARLGRHAALLHARLLRHLPPSPEPLAYDHFEAFAHSQEEPCGLGTVVGHRSAFLYTLDFAPHRRTGRSTPAQKARQRRLFDGVPRADPYRAAARATFLQLARRFPAPTTLALDTDGKPSYRRALEDPALKNRVHLRAHPNPKGRRKGHPRSAADRARDRALFPVDQLHRFLRHSCAHHRRETIAFARRHNALLERAALFAVWRNLVQRRSERRSRSPVPAAALGIVPDRWTWDRVLARRIFRSEELLDGLWDQVYRRTLPTRGLPRIAPHDLKNAF